MTRNRSATSRTTMSAQTATMDRVRASRDAGLGRILIVEDEGIVADDLAETLQVMEYSVVAIVASGEEAITTTRDLQPDLVLMDIRLAGAMDGIEAARQIPCGLVPNELMTNSPKHAFKDGGSGRLRVQLARVGDDMLRLSVADARE